MSVATFPLSQNDLAALITKIARCDGGSDTTIPALTLYRRSKVSEPIPCIYGLGIAVAAQGRKRLTVGDDVIEYGPGQSLLTTIDLPGVSHISQASMEKPYLGLFLRLDAKWIAQLSAEMELTADRQDTSRRAISCQPLDAGLHDAFYRLVVCANEPQALRTHLAPLIQREICVRLLTSAHGSKLWHMVSVGSPTQHIARVVSWIKQHFHTDIEIDSLAAMANMSASTFRLHFRAVCGMSPLQFIKHIRLQEARQILLTQRLDAAAVAHQVGYESASQFTREYKRLFGNPPLRDLKMRQVGSNGNVVSLVPVHVASQFPTTRHHFAALL